MRHPEWFYRRSHIVSEPWELASLRNYQAGVTLFENGAAHPKSAEYAAIRETLGEQWSWSAAQDLLDDDGNPAVIGAIEIHAHDAGRFRVLKAIRIDERANGATYGTLIQMRLEYL